MLFLLWLKKYWGYLVFALGLIVAFLFGLEMRKAPVMVSGQDKKQKDAVDKANATEQKGAQVEQQQEQKAEEDHAQVLDAETVKEQQQAAIQDPGQVNDWLKKVGKDAKGG